MTSREGNLRVLYRHKKGTTQHSIKFQTVFDHPAEHILALIHEWDLIPTWNKFSLETIRIAEPSIFESYVYGSQWMMRPFRNMQAFIHARGFDLAETHRSLLILASDASDLSKLPKGHAPLSKHMDTRKTLNLMPVCFIKLQPRNLPGSNGVSRTNASMIVNLDPHIPYVPGALINFVLGIIAPYVYNQMNKVLTNAFADENGIYPQRIKEQPELYGYAQQRMAGIAEELMAAEEKGNT